MKAEIENKVNFEKIRYAQCWEDADILLEAMNIQTGDIILSIASAGDNSFSMLTKNPKKVYAIDLNPTQLACVELRKKMYRYLTYEEFLTLYGVKNGDRIELYNKIRQYLPTSSKLFWDNHLEEIKNGIMNVGKFENYFKLFREKIMPLIHTKTRINQLLSKKNINERRLFYNKKWNNLRWKCLFRIFFSKFIMGHMGRDPEFFNYVEGKVSTNILKRAKHALTELPTNENPYLRYILYGNFKEKCLPHALRRENFEKIKNNINKLETVNSSIEQFLSNKKIKIDAFNLSDIFEYMSEETMEELYSHIINASKKGTRICYWNMLVPRKCPKKFEIKIISHTKKAEELLNKDKAFFYSKFILEEVK